MKRSFALALAMLTLVCALTACGGKKTTDSPGSGPSGTMSADPAQPDPDTGNAGSSQNSSSNSGTANSGSGSPAEDAGDMLEDGVRDVENAVDDALTGDNARQRSTGGVPYDQMLNNDR